jgi:DNA-binding Xre family transcriptional regulator
MRLRVPELLEQHGISAYELAKRSDGAISLSAAYRLARGDAERVSLSTLEALCRIFKIRDPGPLFSRD